MDAPVTSSVAICYVLAAQAAAAMRMIASGAPASAVSRAMAAFVAGYNQNRGGLIELARARAVLPAEQAIPTLAWSAPSSNTAWTLFETLDYRYCALTPQGYADARSITNYTSNMVQQRADLESILGRLAYCIDNDREPFLALVNAFEARFRAVSFDSQAYDAAVRLAFTHLTYVPSSGDAPPPPSVPTTGQGTSIHDPNVYSVVAQRPGRRTAIPAAVWVLGAATVLGGIGVLAIRRMR